MTTTPEAVYRTTLAAADAVIDTFAELQAAEAKLNAACRAAQTAKSDHRSALLRLASAVAPSRDTVAQAACGARQASYYAAQAALANASTEYIEAFRAFDTQRRKDA